MTEIFKSYELAQRATADPSRAELLADLAYHIGRVDRVEGTKIAQEAIRVADEAGDDVARLSAILTLGRVCARDLRADNGLPGLRRAEEIARERGDTESLVRARVSISDALFEIGDYAESARTAALGTADALKIGVSRSNGAYLRSNHAEALVALGRWDEADAVLAESARFDPPGALGLHWIEVRAGLRVARGHAGADELVRPGAGLPRPAVRRPAGAAAAARARRRRGPGGRRSRGRRDRRGGGRSPTRRWTTTRGTRGRCWPPPRG